MESNNHSAIANIITKLADGIWCIELPHTSFQTVNAFLIEGEILTLIDSGAPIESSTTQLIQALRYLGYEWTDLDLILLTHSHIDHLGGAARLKPSPQIWAYEGTTLELSDYNEYIDRWLNYPEWLSKQYPDIAALLRNRYSLEWMKQAFPKGGELRVTREFSDGEIINLGNRKLRVIYTPGHGWNHVCFYLEEEQLLFSGDFILSRGPAFARYMGDEIDTFLTSARKVKGLEAQLIWPSHGKAFPFEKGMEHIEAMISRQEERLLKRLAECPGTVLDLFFAYYGAHSFNPHSVAMEFTGIDSLIHRLMSKGKISFANGWYALS